MSHDDPFQTRGSPQNRPEEVDALATRVISVLRDRQVGNRDGVRQFVLDHLFRAILSRGAFDAALMLDELRGHRLSLDDIIDLYIPQASCRLGDAWVADDISFADVTVGALRLQALLGETTGRIRLDLTPDDNRMRVLAILPHNEQHFLGLNVAVTQLRRMGCEVSVSFDETLGALQARLQEDTPDLVLITCARRETLETIAETVHTIRMSCTSAPKIALGGAVLSDTDDLEARTGVDVVTRSVKEAVAFCSNTGKVSTPR